MPTTSRPITAVPKAPSGTQSEPRGDARMPKAIVRSLVLSGLLCMAGLANATSVAPMPLEQMVREADHVVVATVSKVDMVDGRGRQVTDPEARTGPGLDNEIRLHLAVSEVLHTRTNPLPDTLVVPLWSMWHYTLASITESAGGTSGIFLLKGDDFQPAYPADFQRSLDERAEIERLLQAGSDSYEAAKASYQSGDYASAAEHSAKALADAARQGEHSGAMATALSLDGAIRLARADYDGAQSAFERATAILESMPERDAAALASIYNNLGEVERARGRDTEAIEWQRKTLALVETSFGSSHIQTAGALESLALALHASGELGEAEKLYERALAIMRVSLPDKDPGVMRVMANQADLLSRMGRHDEAIHSLREIVKYDREVYGDVHPNLANSLNTLGSAHADAGDPSAALETYAQALAIRRQALGENHPQVATVLSNMAVTYRDLGNVAEARAHFSKAIEILKASQAADENQLQANMKALEALGP